MTHLTTELNNAIAIFERGISALADCEPDYDIEISLTEAEKFTLKKCFGAEKSTLCFVKKYTDDYIKFVKALRHEGFHKFLQGEIDIYGDLIGLDVWLMPTKKSLEKNHIFYGWTYQFQYQRTHKKYYQNFYFPFMYHPASEEEIKAYKKQLRQAKKSTKG